MDIKSHSSDSATDTHIRIHQGIVVDRVWHFGHALPLKLVQIVLGSFVIVGQIIVELILVDRQRQIVAQIVLHQMLGLLTERVRLRLVERYRIDVGEQLQIFQGSFRFQKSYVDALLQAEVENVRI